jgi:hypothetical protein
MMLEFQMKKSKLKGALATVAGAVGLLQFKDGGKEMQNLPESWN